MRYFMSGIISGVFALTACAPSPAPQKTSVNSEAFHADLLTLDTHVDIPLNFMREIDPGSETDLQVDLGKLDQGALDAVFFIVYTPQGRLDTQGYVEARATAQTRYDAISEMLDTYPEQIELALTADDVRRIVKSGKHAALIGMENAYPLADDIDALSLWAQRGVRYVGITHFGHNQFGDSSNPHPERDDGPRHDGLSDLGRMLVSALNDKGIMIDVSHASKATMMQATTLSRAPVIASHSGVKAVGDNARNLDDEQLRAIAENGGVAQMVAFDGYVKPLSEAQLAQREEIRAGLGLSDPASRANLSAEAEAAYTQALQAIYDIEPRASIADFVDHIDHAVQIAGMDHVGISSDFDGGGGVVGWDDATTTPAVTAELVRRGYSAEDIAKIWGGNLLRVMEAVEAAARP